MYCGVHHANDLVAAAKHQVSGEHLLSYGNDLCLMKTLDEHFFPEKKRLKFT